MLVVRIDRRALIGAIAVLALLVPLVLGVLMGSRAQRSEELGQQPGASAASQPTLSPLEALDQTLRPPAFQGTFSPPTPNPTVLAVPRISVEEAFQRFGQAGTVFIDSRDAEAYRLGHIKGALLIPEWEITSRMADLPRDAEIIVYCDCWNEAIAAREAAVLLDNGFSGAKALQGGWRAWLDAGYPTELGDPPTPTP